MPLLVEEVKKLKNATKEELKKALKNYDNKKVLGEVLKLIRDRLTEIAEEGMTIP
jgi:phosphopantothenate synthetase